jgi:ABC-type anion transport system duplicated permease subunit
MKKTLLTISLIVSNCFFAFAAVGGVVFTPFERIINSSRNLLDKVLPLLIGIGLIGFFWYMVVFVWLSVDNPTERQKAKVGMAWALGAMFLMICVWGIIAFISSTLGTELGGEMKPFKLPGER